MSMSLADLAIGALLFGVFALSPIYPFILFLKNSPAPLEQKGDAATATTTEQKVPLIDDAPSIVAGWHRPSTASDRFN
jgi:hypothetical protein